MQAKHRKSMTSKQKYGKCYIFNNFACSSWFSFALLAFLLSSPLSATAIPSVPSVCPRGRHTYLHDASFPVIMLTFLYICPPPMAPLGPLWLPMAWHQKVDKVSDFLMIFLDSCRRVSPPQLMFHMFKYSAQEVASRTPPFL